MSEKKKVEKKAVLSDSFISERESVHAFLALLKETECRTTLEISAVNRKKIVRGIIGNIKTNIANSSSKSHIIVSIGQTHGMGKTFLGSRFDEFVAMHKVFLKDGRKIVPITVEIPVQFNEKVGFERAVFSAMTNSEQVLKIIGAIPVNRDLKALTTKLIHRCGKNSFVFLHVDEFQNILKIVDEPKFGEKSLRSWDYSEKLFVELCRYYDALELLSRSLNLFGNRCDIFVLITGLFPFASLIGAGLLKNFARSSSSNFKSRFLENFTIEDEKVFLETSYLEYRIEKNKSDLFNDFVCKKSDESYFYYRISLKAFFNVVFHFDGWYDTFCRMLHYYSGGIPRVIYELILYWTSGDHDFLTRVGGLKQNKLAIENTFASIIPLAEAVFKRNDLIPEDPDDSFVDLLVCSFLRIPIEKLLYHREKRVPMVQLACDLRFGVQECEDKRRFIPFFSYYGLQLFKRMYKDKVSQITQFSLDLCDELFLYRHFLEKGEILEEYLFQLLAAKFSTLQQVSRDEDTKLCDLSKVFDLCQFRDVVIDDLKTQRLKYGLKPSSSKEELREESFQYFSATSKMHEKHFCSFGKFMLYKPAPKNAGEDIGFYLKFLSSLLFECKYLYDLHWSQVLKQVEKFLKLRDMNEMKTVLVFVCFGYGKELDKFVNKNENGLGFVMKGGKEYIFDKEIKEMKGWDVGSARLPKDFEVILLSKLGMIELLGKESFDRLEKHHESLKTPSNTMLYECFTGKRAFFGGGGLLGKRKKDFGEEEKNEGLGGSKGGYGKIGKLEDAAMVDEGDERKKIDEDIRLLSGRIALFENDIRNKDNRILEINKELGGKLDEDRRQELKEEKKKLEKEKQELKEEKQELKEEKQELKEEKKKLEKEKAE